jgi:hypothetical protein
VIIKSVIAFSSVKIKETSPSSHSPDQYPDFGPGKGIGVVVSVGWLGGAIVVGANGDPPHPANNITVAVKKNAEISLTVLIMLLPLLDNVIKLT